MAGVVLFNADIVEASIEEELVQGLALPEPDRAVILERMERQLRNAREWRDVVNTFFHRFSGAEDEKGRKIYV